MGRPREAKKRRQTIWMTEELYIELAFLRPELRDAQGFIKYGAISKYVNSLIRKDLENRKTEVLAG